MPFKSKAQQAKFRTLVDQGKISKETFDRWQTETGKEKLPERVVKQGSTKIKQVKVIK